MVNYDSCRTVLQFFMAERLMDETRLANIILKVTGSDNNKDVIINEINSKIREFSQKIVKGNCEVSGVTTYSLIGTADEPDVGSQFSKELVDYFYPVMDAIITSSGCLDLIDALNIAQTVTTSRISLSEAEKHLELFVTKRLLVLEAGSLYLSPLAISEFGPYINDNYALDPCLLCKKMLIFGKSCHHCNAPIHGHCLTNFIRNSNKHVKCPQCKELLEE